ncbi:reverse transcriptase [Tanacetum coccineum]|uniref:Reverse transcriptase n=1 Tax=Tanacetum coccineum TaxID=301880 RepID=A0ABQ5BFU0_9ASTR
MLSQPKQQGGLGFRDFEAFNTALLAKQGWRLLINPDAFWGRILKGIYFSNLNFLVAKKGSHPSWLWSSLLHGHDLLLQGVRWQVGNGRSISFWTQKLVPFCDDFYIHSPLGPFHNRNTVFDYIEDGHWNVKMICKHISATKAEMVLQIPISKTGSSDKLIWHFDLKGQYTVKSGYKQAIALMSTPESMGESSTNPSSKFWKVIWHIPVQPKIKLFLWKAISNSVATKENLFRRNCSPSQVCLICNICTESIEYLLFECAWTRPVWFGSPLSFRPPQSEFTHQSISSLTTTVTNLDSTSHTSPRWIPSHSSSVKLNCDAAFKNSSDAFGIVARDSTGLLRYVIGNRCYAVSLLHAEIIAVHSACLLAFNHGWLNAIVESNSQIAISLSLLDMSPPWSLAALVEDIRIWAKNMHIRFSWVNRESNQVARWVAHNAFSSTLGFSWDVSFPDKLTSLSRSDLYGS